MQWLNFFYRKEYCNCLIDKNKIPIEKTGGLKATQSTISDIVKNYPPPYTLLCSGGVDSQAMAYAWKISNVDHNIICFEYINNTGKIFNQFDLKGFEEFSEKNNISYSKRKFNYFNFLENNLLDYAKKFDCGSPQITAYMRMSELIGIGTVIFGGNYWENLSTHRPFDYDTLGLYRFSLQLSTFKVVPFFFLYSPELAFGFRELDSVKLKELTPYEIKCETFKYNEFPILPQEQKYSGFEKIKDFFDNKKNLITYNDKLKFLNKPSQRLFDIKYRYLLREQIGKAPELKITIT